jgi:hypothetical protein
MLSLSPKGNGLADITSTASILKVRSNEAILWNKCRTIATSNSKVRSNEAILWNKCRTIVTSNSNSQKDVKYDGFLIYDAQ